MTSQLQEIIKEALVSSMSFDEYVQLMKSLVEAGKTSGPKQNEDLAHFTMLNDQRMTRLIKKSLVSDQMKAAIQRVKEPQTWLIITESWCGDAAQVVPLLQKIADENPMVETRYALRDEHLDLIDEFLTRGGRSIPKLIMLTKSLEVLGTWGPRPAAAQRLYDDWKNSDPKIPYQDFSVTLQKWYLKDKGASTFEEISLLVNAISKENFVEQGR